MAGITIENPILLGVLVVLIVGAIVLLQAGKAAPATPVLPDVSTVPTPLAAVQKDFPLAPDFAGISGRINAPETLTLSSLRGKVVLVDFWTYSCINCIRTLPYLTSWHEKYSA
ncbi:MAG: hypothetical protein Q8P02_00805, partial [Candidatus Micrarchaeota archaeon]|nr:hypothetical protein [Candidatus Micrarchaeota archaeon]